MRYLASVALLICMFALAGCPVMTQNSIDNGTADASWMAGKWIEYTASGTKNGGYLLEKGKTRSSLTCYDMDTLGNRKKTEPMPLIVSEVGGVLYVNAYSNEENNKGYYLLRLRKISNTEFVLTPVREHEIDYMATRDEIQKFLTENKSNDDILDDAEEKRYKKMK